MLCLISFCIILLLESAAHGRPKADDRLAPRDTIELHVWRWTALRDGVLEALQLNHTFTIDSAGTLDLPVIGNIAAAGLREGELAELISDRLQARSGRQERADTTVKLIRDLPSDITGSVEHPGKRKAPEPPADAADDSSSAVASERASVEKSKAVAQPGVRGSNTPWQPAAEQQQALEGALLNELSAARMEIAAAREEALAARQTARNDAVRHNQILAAARQRAAALVRELDAVRTDRAALEQKLLAALKEVEALRKSVQPARGDHEAVLGRELAAARAELGAMQRGARDASAQARAVADMMAEQGQALKQQRRRAEALALDLEVARREAKGLKAKAILADHEKAAMLEARHSAETSVAEAQRALDEERHKAERFARELTAARQTIDALKTSANLAAAAQTNAIKERQVAEAALKRAGDALELERERADSAARDLDSARRERDAAKQEASRVSMELSVALDQERNKTIGLARDLSAARKAIDTEKARDERRTERMNRAPKARAGATSRGDVSARSRPARQLGVRENHKVKIKRRSRPVLVATIALPDALLPTRPPKLGSR